RGTSAAARPGADWNRALFSPLPQPIQSDDDGAKSAFDVHRFASTFAADDFPVTNAATASFSSPLSDEPCSFINPDSSARTTLSGDIIFRALTAGARLCAGESWQTAHR